MTLSIFYIRGARGRSLTKKVLVEWQLRVEASEIECEESDRNQKNLKESGSFEGDFTPGLILTVLCCMNESVSSTDCSEVVI